MDLNPYAAPRTEAAAPEAPPPPGKWTVVVQVMLLLAMLAAHAFLLLGAVLHIQDGTGPEAALEQLSRGSGDATGPELGGTLIVYFCVVVWGPLSMAWATGNIVALALGARWSYRSLFAYWVANLVVCLWAPLAVFGLAHLVASRSRLPGTRVT